MDTTLGKELYKLFQLSSIFINRYGFNQVLIQNYSSYNNIESWLFNPNDINYQLIRVTLNDTSQTEFDYSRIEEYINYFSARMSNLSFIDIHIGKEEYHENSEKYPHCIIEEEYAAGVDLKNIYPEVYTAIHKVNDSEVEIVSLINAMKNTIDKRRSTFKQQNKPIATYILIGICVLIYLICEFLSTKYNRTSVFIFLGADYMTFTLGLRQFYRLITCAFIHGSIIHLFSNMYSLYILGNYFEREYGTRKYLITLFVCILVGSLSQSILSQNTINVGMSGGLYGLMTIFILDLVIKRRVPISNFMTVILVNLSINFISTTAWVAHLGGLITGYLLFKIYDEKNNIGLIGLLSIMILALFVKFISIDKISPFYVGTDNEIVKMVYNTGLKNYAISLAERLSRVYTNYGG